MTDRPDPLPPWLVRLPATTQDFTDPLVTAAWCAELTITGEQLAKAVQAVGGMPDAIRYYFRSKGNSWHLQQPTTQAVVAHGLKQAAKAVRLKLAFDARLAAKLLKRARSTSKP